LPWLLNIRTISIGLKEESGRKGILEMPLFFGGIGLVGGVRLYVEPVSGTKKRGGDCHHSRGGEAGQRREEGPWEERYRNQLDEKCITTPKSFSRATYLNGERHTIHVLIDRVERRSTQKQE